MIINLINKYRGKKVIILFNFIIFKIGSEIITDRDPAKANTIKIFTK